MIMMRRKLSKLLAFVMILCLALPVFGGLAAPVTAQAASPALNVTSKKIYLGTTFQLQLKNVDTTKVKSISWKANRSSIAKVDQTGLVTPVKVGTTTIKCTLTYNDGTQEVLSCKAVVRNRVVATAVKITNASTGDMNAQSMYIGDTFTIKKTVTPSNTTDTAYYISYDEAIAAVSTTGVITAKAEGITMIEVRYGTSKTDAMRADNTAVARMYLYVTKKPAPTATPTPAPTPAVLPEVTSVKMTGSQELQVNFSAPVIKNSVINGTKLVTGAIVLGKAEGAADFGSITPSLSSDRKQLTLSVTGSFSGTYSVVISDKVQADGGTPFTQYAEVLTLKDTTGPNYLYTSVGYTGWSSSINFDEPLDISRLSIEGVSGTTDAALVNYLKDPANYILSEDKKSILIDLSAYTSVKNLVVTVTLKGIRDTAGNSTSKLLQNVTVRTDASSKPLASIVKTERISKTEIKVTFSSAIFSPGIAKFGYDQVVGVVSTEDPTVVIYEIPSAYQSKTGTQIVEFSSWYNYNAVSFQDIAISRPVDFTLDTTPPQLVSYELVNAVLDNSAVCKLILTYNKEIATTSTNQEISVRAKNVNGNISTLTAVSTYATVEGCVVTYFFQDNALMENGDFTIILPAGMVVDKLYNYSNSAQITILKNGTSSDELPEPYVITQDPQDLSTIYLTFANKLDLSSAEQVQNYYLAGNKTYPVAASVVSQDDTGATVALTFASGTFISGVSSYELVISGVKGYNGTYNAITESHVIFTAAENTPPAITGSIRLNYATITMTMSEEVVGSLKITATDTSTGTTISGTGYATGNYIYINLDNVPVSSAVRFVITENNVYDINGNKAALKLNQTYIATSIN